MRNFLVSLGLSLGSSPSLISPVSTSHFYSILQFHSQHKINMQRHQQKHPIHKSKFSQPSNFDPLLKDIRAKLGPDWEFYNEFLEGVTTAATRGEDVSAWFEQIEPLVKGREDIYFAHEGVLFLLAEKGVKVQSESKSPSHMLPPTFTFLAHPSNINNTTTDTTTTNHNMAPPALPLRLAIPPPPSPRTMQREYLTERGLLPSTPPVALFTDQMNTPNVAFFGERSINHERPTCLQNGKDPIFFTDPVFTRDVYTFFGHLDGTRKRNKDKLDPNNTAPEYNAEDDDLQVWKERKDYDGKVKDSRTKDYSGR
jgi:hypothetical protein